MIDATFVEAINKLSPGGNLTVGEKTYTSRQYFNLPREEESPVLETRKGATLDGLVDFHAEGAEFLFENGVAAYIVSPHEVQLVSDPFGFKRHRETYLIVDCSDMGKFRFGGFMPLIELQIGLQSLFVETPDRAALLLALGTIKDENITTSLDNGVTQVATFSTGVSLVDNRAIPNPVTLAPYRTFREIDQPESKFVFRLQKGRTGLEGALFEADGGAWQLAAITSIKNYLKTKFSADSLSIIA